MKEKLNNKESFWRLKKHESDKRDYLKLIRLSGLSLIIMLLFLISGCKDTGSHSISEPVLHPSSKEKSAKTLAGIKKKVMHLNICGNVCWSASDVDGGGVDSRGSTSRMTRVLSAVDSYDPHILTFNEICYSQYRAIRTALIARGYGSTYASTTTGGGCDNFDASWGQGFWKCNIF